MTRILSFALAIALVFAASLIVLGQAQSQKEVLTNTSVIQLVQLGLGEAVIIQKIRQSDHNFDTTSAGLAQLKTAKVSDNIIMEMMNVAAPAGSNNASPTVAPATSRQPTMTDPFGVTALGPSSASGSGNVLLLDGDKRIEMKYSTPDMRTNSMLGAMVNPLHKSRVRAALKGNHAALRVINSSPIFEIGIERDANPSDVAAVVKLEAKSETREIETGRGSITGVSSGFRKQDLVAVQFEEGASNSTTQRIYRIKLVNPLVPGEYALLYRGGAYYDFGVDAAK